MYYFFSSKYSKIEFQSFSILIAFRKEFKRSPTEYFHSDILVYTYYMYINVPYFVYKFIFEYLINLWSTRFKDI